MFAEIINLISEIAHLILGIGTGQNFPPPLSHAEEQECFALAAKGDEKAREKLILHNLRLVAHIVRKYYSTAKNQEDLVSIGSIGLVKAVDSFKKDTGVKFATYAAKCIQNEILMYFRSQKKLLNEVSINETIDSDKDGNPLTYIDVIGAEDDPSYDIDRGVLGKRAAELAKNALSGRERKVIVLRYGLDGRKPLTQREVAAELDISRSYVSRIEKSALEKLKAKLGG